jgi:KaiC/GvpD/RAD55 family RecA-like ATPase
MRTAAAKQHDATLHQVRAVDLADFLAIEIPPREMVLAPWLPEQGIAMIHAARGAGKTLLAQHVAYVVASGFELMYWKAPKARGVLYIDGEMPASVLQARFAQIADSLDRTPAAPLRIITPDLQPGMLPDLSTMSGQRAIDEAVTDDIRLIIADNLSSLCRFEDENAAESWTSVQTWALAHRKAGRTILFIHHSNKGGAQRGTSRREDVLDSVIALRRPAKYTPEDGAVFEVVFEKARGVHGADVRPFEAALTTTPDGKWRWMTRTTEQSTRDKIIEMLADGLSQAEVARELGVNRSTVCRAAKGISDES